MGLISSPAKIVGLFLDTYENSQLQNGLKFVLLAQWFMQAKCLWMEEKATFDSIQYCQKSRESFLYVWSCVMRANGSIWGGELPPQQVQSTAEHVTFSN